MPTLLEPPSPSVTFLSESTDADGIASGWILGDGPAQPVQMPPEGLDGWRTVFAEKTVAGCATLPAVETQTNPLWWLLGGAVLAGVGVAIVAGLE